MKLTKVFINFVLLETCIEIERDKTYEFVSDRNFVSLKIDSPFMPTRLISAVKTYSGRHELWYNNTIDYRTSTLCTDIYELIFWKDRCSQAKKILHLEIFAKKFRKYLPILIVP